jgi:O-succinylbenzoic acid--CoA ligase
VNFSVLAAADEAPTRVAVRTDERAWTWSEVAARARRAMAFLDGTVPPGAPIAFVAAPRLEALALLFAAVERGHPVLPLHPKWTPDESRAAVLAADARVLDVDTARSRPAPPTPSLRPPLPDDERWLALIRTSGTSGAPKLAVLSRRAFAASAEASAENLGWRDDDGWLLALPFAHVGGLSVLLRCLRARRTIVLSERNDLHTPGVTLASLVPTQLARLLETGTPPPLKLRAILIGGAAAAPSLVTSARRAGWPILLTYGMTETCSQVATQARPPAPTNDGSCGRPLRGFDVEAREGVLHVRGNALFSGYLENGELRRALGDDGWLRTGDLGEVDGEGVVRVSGRADDVIVTGGEKVSPSRVEAVLSAVRGVEAACVFGLPDATWGELVCAAVVTKRPEKELEAELSAACAGLATYERPRRLAFLDALPTTSSGKVVRRRVRELARVRPFRAGEESISFPAPCASPPGT